MISLVSLAIAGPNELLLTFSDNSFGVWSAEEVIARNTELTGPLGKPEYFACAFIEGGEGLAWPNGLEFSAAAIHRKLNEAGRLVLKAA